MMIIMDGDVDGGVGDDVKRGATVVFVMMMLWTLTTKGKNVLCMHKVIVVGIE